MKALSLLYINLMTRLSDKIPAIKHIDIWNNQVFFETKEDAFNRPAVFIELPATILQRNSNKAYSADTQIRIHVVCDFNSTTDLRSSAAVRSRAFEHLEVMDQIFYYLDGYNHEDTDQYGLAFNSMSCESIEFQAADSSNIIYHVMNFRTRMQINTAKHTFIIQQRPDFEVSGDLITD